VSRAHAHLVWILDEQVFRLHDDGSTQGTRVLRAGRQLEVPGRGGRGVALQSGDVLVLGRARVHFLVA
jgi:pSer/pThr/pTyr-binding forkhead associated (FHA) protein